jgi:hypothetical protein
MTPRDEDELESYLQRRALLRAHRSYQESLEPPPELDQIVLRKARLAIQISRPPEVRQAPRAHRHRRRWYAPASVAATVLVCLTLLGDLGVHALRTLDHAPASRVVSDVPSAAAQASATVLADAEPEAQAAPTVYAAANLYTSYSGQGSTPIFEVVIRTARLAARPVSDSPRSAGPASR